MAENFRAVLMADDDEEDRLIAEAAFEASGAQAHFDTVADGSELLEYLRARAAGGGSELPKLVLLDLNMPRKDGREALAEIKGDPELIAVPVVIFTTSGEPKDIAIAMEAGASSFITKPDSFDDWVEVMKSLAGKWLH